MAESNQQLEVDLFNKLDQWNNYRPVLTPKVRIVVVGCEGFGKTTLAYSLTDTKPPQSSHPVQRKIGDVELLVHDTPYLEIDPAMTDKCLKKISSTTPMGKSECSAWIYAISMVHKTRFEENDENLKLMKKISQHFQESVWENAIIVLTYADRYIKLHKQKHPDDNNVKEMFETKVKEWTDSLHDFLETTVKLKSEIAQKIPVIASGLPNNIMTIEDESEVAKSKPKTIEDELEVGMSWTNDIWLSLLSVATQMSQPFIVEIVLRLLFRGPILSGKCLVSLLTNHHLMFEHKASIFAFDLCTERTRLVSYACSILHSRNFMLQYSSAIHCYNLSLCLSDKDNKLLENWRKMSHVVNFIVFGGCGSGKTSLINSLFYGKEYLKEDNSTSEFSWQSIDQNELTCSVCDTPGLDDQSSAGIQQNLAVNETDFVFFCIRITDEAFLIESNIKKVNEVFGINIWRKVIVVLTYSNTFEFWLNYEAEIERISKSVQEIFRKLAITYSIPIIPSGYHKDGCIRKEPSKNVWFITLWMKVISIAPNEHQAMLITWLNTNVSLRKNWNKVCKLAFYYRRMLIELLSTME